MNLAGENGRQRMKTGSRKVQLIQIAAKIFAEEGYTETSIDRISNEAGLTGPALYRHFSSKQEILDTICVSGVEQALEAAREIQIEADSTVEETLKKLIMSRLDYLFGPLSAAYLLAANQKAHLSQAARERVGFLQTEFRDMCGSLLKKIKPEVTEAEIKVAFFAVQSMIIYTTWRYKDRGMLSPDELKNLLARINWNTLLA
jgi:AcrR family transcriptional regulator